MFFFIIADHQLIPAGPLYSADWFSIRINKDIIIIIIIIIIVIMATSLLLKGYQSTFTYFMRTIE